MSVGVPMYFPLEANHDLCSTMKITKNGQDQLLHHRINRCSDQSKYYIWAIEVHVCMVVLNSVMTRSALGSDPSPSRAQPGLTPPCVSAQSRRVT